MPDSRYFRIIFFWVSVLVFFDANFVFADEFISADFKILHPVMFSPSYSTSSDYRLLGSISQFAVGTSTSSGFGVNSGFLFYPFVSTPVISASPGDGSVALSWTAAVGVLGWTASGYNVGQSTISGGPYAYSSVGSVTSSTRSGLANGTVYYFIVRVEDAFGNSIATSSEVSATPVASASPAPPSPVSGGGPPILDLIQFIPGSKFDQKTGLPKPFVTATECGKADFNCDGIVDLADLSVFLYLSAIDLADNPADLNRDAKIDLSDASIVLYSWSEKIMPRTFGQSLTAFSSVRRLPEKGINPQGAKRIQAVGVQKEEPLLLKTAAAKVGFIDGIVDSVKSAVFKAVNYLMDIPGWFGL